jgi:hypothetical protein
MKEFLRFKMKGCPACIDSQPAWNQFKRSCKSKLAPKCRLKEVDSEKTGAYSFEVDSFPTYIVLVDGVPTPYEGSREAAALEKHIQKKGFLNKSRKRRTRKR